MKQLAKFIIDERTGLKYELCGDYYIIAGEDEPEREPIGIWGQRHLRYIQKHSKAFYNKMKSENKLYNYLLQLNQDAEEMFNIISQEFTDLSDEYLINETEGEHIAESLRAKLVGDTLKDMYASEDRQKFAHELIEPLFEEEVSRRSEIVIPTAEELRNEMKTVLTGIVFIH